MLHWYLQEGEKGELQDRLSRSGQGYFHPLAS